MNGFLRHLGGFLLLACLLGSPALAASNGACRIEGEPSEVVPLGEFGVALWRARRGQMLHCDAVGFEPVDQRCGDGCRPGPVRVELLPARTVGVDAEGSRDALRLEWRRLGPPGEPTELLATRDVPVVDGGAKLEVAAADDRILRFVAGSASPRSIFVPRVEGADMGETLRLTPGRVVPGGEVFGFFEVAEAGAEAGGEGLEPSALYLQGVSNPSFRAELILGEFGEFSLRGLTAGIYRPHAVFRGGGESLGPDIEVVEGTTAELIPWRAEAPPPDPSASDMGTAAVTLAGTVRIGQDRPVADLRVEASPMDAESESQSDVKTEPKTGSADQAPAAITDATGGFELDLPAAGWWRLSFFTSSTFPVREQEIELEPGRTETTFEMGDAALYIHVVRDDGEPLDEPVEVELRRRGEIDVLRSGTLWPDPDLGPEAADLLLLDLTYQSYEVSAYTESGWTSVQRGRAELTKNESIAHVNLVLSQDRRIVSVRLPDGSLAQEILVALDRRQMSPNSSGEFELTGATAQSEVRVMPTPEWVAVCRRIGQQKRIEIQLQPAGTEAILVPPHERMPATGRFLGVLEGLPGSDCPMPVALQWQPFRDEHGRARILLPGLAPGVYSLRTPDGRKVDFEAPGPPVPLSSESSPPK